jgi:hypothetical protein
MYEYIPNKIIEGTIKSILYIFSYANTLYFNEEFLDEDQPQCPEAFLQLGFESESDPEEYAWEYDLKEFISYLFHYLLNGNDDKSKMDETSQTQTNPTSATLQVDYVDKYKDRLKSRLSDKASVKKKEQVDLEALKKSVLIENTPFGNVIMYYDSLKNSFVYYCDKTLSYPIVNTVGRKYVLTFKCESLYIDESTPKEETKEPQPLSQEQEQESLQKKNVYAKFKNYKKPNPNQTPSTQQEEINRYTCEGKLANFNFLQKISKVKPLSYKDFKNKLNK